MAWGLGTKTVICPFCGYDKYKPDPSTSICIKCGGNLKFEGNPGYVLPRKWKRRIAFLIDLVPLGFFLWLTELLTGNRFSESGPGILFSLGYVLIYFTVLPGFLGYTLGQKVFGVKTVDIKTLRIPSFRRLLLREMLFLTTLTGFGLLYFLFRGFYWDRISKTTPIISSK